MSDDASEADEATGGRTVRIRWGRCGGALLAGVALALGGTWGALYSSAASEPLPTSLPDYARLPSFGPFPKQGPNECGAYSLAQGLAVYGEAVDPTDLVGRVSHQVAWSSALSGTVPWKIVAEAGRRGYAAADYTARTHPRARRLDLLREHLARAEPCLILIESERDTQHYVLVVGYSKDARFDLYDPNFEADPEAPARTLDANGERSGNRTLEAEALLERWGRGGIAGLYTWWYLPLAR